MYIPLIIIAIIFIFGFAGVSYIRHKLFHLELELYDIFKRRNYQVVSIYGISKTYLNKHDDIFKEFLRLKKRDFSENIHNLGIEGKLPVYKAIHNEINFIFKVCEKHHELQKNAMYNYIKESLLKKSNIVGKKYEIYKESRTKFNKIHRISKMLLFGFLVRN